MGRHYSINSQLTVDHILLSGSSKGKALVICNRKRRQHWNIEHKHACCVLEQQFGLQVELHTPYITYVDVAIKVAVTASECISLGTTFVFVHSTYIYVDAAAV